MKTMSSDCEWPGIKRQRRKRKGRREHREKLQTARFVAWDGEGYSDDNDDHHYMLFGNSLGESVKAESLTWKQCFPLLLEEREGINVIFGGDYDIIMMTKGMPWPVRQRLLTSKPVRYDHYRMVWFRRKYFMLKDVNTGRSTILYDVLSFFQTSFVKACREYLGNDETLDHMHEMKLKRDKFTYDDGDVTPYWRDELDYLVRLCDRLRELLAEVNIHPRGWYGPGAVASALLKLHDMKRYYETPIPPEIVDLGEKAYYGGRFEQFKVGKINRIHEYDIRSAYPKAITELPDFSHCAWREESLTHNPVTFHPYGLYFVSWDVEFTPHQIGPLPWRDPTGRIFFPLKGSGWYWGIEVEECLGKSFPPHMYRAHTVMIPTGLDFASPFAWVQQMYDDRAAMKAAGNPAQKALKLGMNSLYGKLAQSTGARKDKRSGEWLKPKWHNVLWAGWVTAATRARIFDALRKQRATVVAIETDAVFTTKPIPDITLGEGLGEWEETTIDQILYIFSGVYYALNNGVWKLKSRGVESDRSHSADYWLKVFEQLPHKMMAVTLTIRRFGTDIRQPSRYGRWYDHVTTTVLPSTFSKRMHHPDNCVTCIIQQSNYAEAFHYMTVPQAMIESDYLESTPYGFPWREDVRFRWSSDFSSREVIEDIGDVQWEPYDTYMPT